VPVAPEDNIGGAILARHCFIKPVAAGGATSQRRLAMVRICGQARNAGWASLRVIGVVAAVVVAMTFDAHFNARSDGPTPVSPDDRIGNGHWCVAAHARNGIRDCGYLTFDQCLRAMESAGGTCRPNAAALAIVDDGPYRIYRPVYPDHEDHRR
jgi:hypothetical protein